MKKTTWWIEVEHKQTKVKYEVPFSVNIGGSFVSLLVSLPCDVDNIYRPPFQGTFHLTIRSFIDASDEILSQDLSFWLYRTFKETCGRFEGIVLRQVTIPKKLGTKESIKRIVGIFKRALKMASEI